MTRIPNWLANKVAKLLEPAEREAVLGDIAECGEAGWQALRDVAGLAARRQLAPWRNFRPWLATIAVAIPTGILAGFASEWLASGYNLYSWILFNYRDFDPSLLAESHISLGHGVLSVARASLTLLAWSCSSGYVIGSLSRFATWLTGTVFCGFFLLAPVALTAQDRPAAGAAWAVAGVALAASFLGMRVGRRPSVPAVVQALFWAASALTAATVYNWFWWPQWAGIRGVLLVLSVYFPAALAANGLWTLWRAAKRQPDVKQPLQ